VWNVEGPPFDIRSSLVADFAIRISDFLRKEGTSKNDSLKQEQRGQKNIMKYFKQFSLVGIAFFALLGS